MSGLANPPVTQPVSGTVSVANFPATQAISSADGTQVTVGNTGDADTSNTLVGRLKKLVVQTVGIALDATVSAVRDRLPAALTGLGNLKISVSESTATVTVSGTVTANQGTPPWRANPDINLGKTINRDPLNQVAAGTTTIAAASLGNNHKVIGCALTLSALGTIKFADGTSDISGPFDVAAQGGFVLPGTFAVWCQTLATNRPLNIVTTGGAARGIVLYITEA